MPRLRSYLRRTNLLIAVMLSIMFWPAATYADTTTPACTPPPATSPGVHEPTGADAGTFTYDCSTGLWENQYYTYDPATGTRSPKYPVVYTYNTSTGQYDTTIWAYNSPSGQYVQRTESVSQPPAGADVVGGPAPAVTSPNPGGNSVSNTGSDSTNSIANNTGGSAAISGTGPDSDNTINNGGSSNTTDNNLLNALIYNNVTANSQSGDATSSGNTTGGSATTGNSQTVADVANLLQSTSNALGGNAITFVANIDGDVNGDLLLDPNALKQVQPSTTAGTTTPAGSNNLTVNNQVDATMNNTISVGASSGNADVSDNTTGGNATSGSAKTIANVINLINSAITSGKSFVGVLNINGNLNGDILLPPNLIDQLVASNVPTVDISLTGPNSTNTVNKDGSSTTTVHNTNDLGINNVVTASAQSGDASVTGNTTAGNATSGSATTHITAFNLTGSSLIGSNALLVFVNVMGTWVGMIVNAPPGATAAELGGGVTSLSNTGPGSTNTVNGTGNDSTALNNDTNLQINNTIAAASRSGDATVSHNTTGGNATSGDAQTAVNLLNVQNSSLSLANWFGILFINVFGSWHGSFGINTAAGNPIIPPVNGGGSASRDMPAPVQAFRFVPHGSSASPTTVIAIAPVSNTATASEAAGPAVLAAHTTALDTVAAAKTPQLQAAATRHNYWLPAAGFVIAAGLLGADRFISRRR